MAGRAYVVQDADGRATPVHVDTIYPYTLRGLTEALEEARFRSYSGTPQLVTVVGEGATRVIRRYSRGREIPLTP
jgi:hypothetical protein